jgi:hypothetical protein
LFLCLRIVDFCHYRDAFLIPIINCLTSFYAGFVIFAVLGFMAKQKGTTVENVATGGTSKICLFVWWSLTSLSTIEKKFNALLRKDGY